MNGICCPICNSEEVPCPSREYEIALGTRENNSQLNTFDGDDHENKNNNDNISINING